MHNTALAQARQILFFVASISLALLGGGCLPDTGTFMVQDGEDAGMTARDGGTGGSSDGSIDDGGPPAPQCELPPTCSEQCKLPMLLTTLNVPGCNGVVLRHSLGRTGACLCDSHSNFFESEATDAMFIAPDTLLVVGEGHLANRNVVTGETRWVHPLDGTVPRTLEPTENEEEVYVIAGEQSEGPVGLHGLGNGAQLRVIDTSLANLTSLTVDHRNKQNLIGISSEGPRLFDTRTRSVTDHLYLGDERDRTIVHLSTVHATPGNPLRITAVHSDNTLSTNATGWPEYLEGCTPDPRFLGATAFSSEDVLAMISIEESAGATGIYMRTGNCSAVLVPSEFSGTTYRVRRTRPQL